MRKLADQIGVQAPSSDYVKGRIVDNQTLINEAINGDIVEFFHKMAGMATITENGLPENTTNGHQLILALKYLIEQYSKLANSAYLIWHKVDIGSWNMDSTGSKTVTLPTPPSGYIAYPVLMEVLINNDVGVYTFKLDFDNGTGSNGYFNFDNTPAPISSPEMTLTRVASGFFDSANFNDGVMNRGYILIAYAPV